MSYPATNHGIISFLFFFLFFLLLWPSPSAAQPTGDGRFNNDYARFSPSIAIIIAVLITALFFMGFFSIYIRNCTNATNANVSNLRPGNGGAGRSLRGNRGLEASVIETFPTMIYSEVKNKKIGEENLECAVCLNEFQEDETLRLIPKCNHVFHPECIDTWLGSHTTCPVCRANLVPLPGEPTAIQLTELNNNSVPELDLEAQNDGGDSEAEEERGINEAQIVPEAEVIDLNRTLNRNRTRGSRSSRPRKLFFPRSHSTGHSLVQPGENTDRFTLRLPDDVRKQLINRKLNRTTSLILPRERSSRQGYRGGEDDGSTRRKSSQRLEKLDRGTKSDRWVFSMAPPFFARASSIKSPKVAAANDDEGTSSLPVGPEGDSNRPPV